MRTRVFRDVRGHLDKLNPEPKSIIVCLDGTWNSPDVDGDETDKSTNVYRVSEALRLPESKQEVVYVKGIGNREENGAVAHALGGLSGVGWISQLHSAYARLVEAYRRNDRIFIFGFSRGAAVARMLALYLEKHGIAEFFRTGRRTTGSPTHRRRQKFFVQFGKKRVPVVVEMLGLWDTVGSFDIPRDILFLKFQKWNLFQNLALAGNVRRAYHLVGIDEARGPFYPTLLDPCERVCELWIPGMHSDVGGGENRPITNIALRFMLNRARDCGLRVNPEFEDLSSDPCASLSPPDENILLGTEIRRVPPDGRFHESTAERYDGATSWRPSNLPKDWRSRVVADCSSKIPASVAEAVVAHPFRPRHPVRRKRRRGKQ